MTEKQIREEEEAQAEYKTAWIEATYIVAGWWKKDLTSVKEQIRGMMK